MVADNREMNMKNGKLIDCKDAKKSIENIFFENFRLSLVKIQYVYKFPFKNTPSRKIFENQISRKFFEK